MKKISVLLSLLFCTVGAFAVNKLEPQIINMKVTPKGYEPNNIDVKAGSNVILKITRTTDETCATEILIPAKNVKTELPLNKEVVVDVGTLDKGDVGFSCGMKMIKGTVHVK